MARSILGDFEHTTVTLFHTNGHEVKLTGFRKFEFIVAPYETDSGKIEWWVFHIPTHSPMSSYDYGNAEKGAAVINDLLKITNDWNVVSLHCPKLNKVVCDVLHKHVEDNSKFSENGTVENEKILEHVKKYNSRLFQ